MKSALRTVVIAIFCFFPCFVFAADYSVSVGAADIFLVPDPPFVGDTVRIYTVINNTGTKDVEGEAVFRDGSTRLGTKPFSVRVNGRSDEVWIPWQPSEGYHDLKIELFMDTGGATLTPAPGTALYGVLIDKDTDGDRVGDRQDLDDDNAHVSDR